MKKISLPILIVVALTVWSSSARAQTLVANFQADDFAVGDSSLEDTEGNISAAVFGSPVANGTSIITNGGGFIFHISDPTPTPNPGLAGMTSYSIAVGFTYLPTTTDKADSGTYAYSATGIFGDDLGGYGEGDSLIAVSSASNGEIIEGGGVSGGIDKNLYDNQVGTLGQPGQVINFVTGSPTGAVFVANGAAGTLSLYVNGALVAQDTGVTVLPFGQETAGDTESFDYGIGLDPGEAGQSTLPGDITQAQIYNGALSASQAELLSTAIALPSVGRGAVVPEPSTWALMLGGLGVFAFIRRRRGLKA